MNEISYIFFKQNQNRKITKKNFPKTFESKVSQNQEQEKMTKHSMLKLENLWHCFDRSSDKLTMTKS